MAESKSMELKFESIGEPRLVRADETRLYHVALNLVENALKYAPVKTTVTVRVAFEDDVVRFSVLDEGPGIPPEEIPKIFEKYYRVKRPDSAISGMGLGLSVVQAMAHGHEGKVTAKNRDEGGMIFTLELPTSRLVKEEEEKETKKQEKA
jgi:signal transduction histidine kinase